MKDFIKHLWSTKILGIPLILHLTIPPLVGYIIVKAFAWWKIKKKILLG